MKRFLILPIALLTVTLFLMPACSDDNDEPACIRGRWVTNHSDTDVPLRLTFYGCDGTFLWEPRGESSHTPSEGSYTFADNVLSIFDDDDCADITGVYSAIIDGETLIISVQEDACDPRIAGMIGTWTRE